MTQKRKKAKIPTISETLSKAGENHHAQVAEIKNLIALHVEEALERAREVAPDCVTDVSDFPEDGWGTDFDPILKVYTKRNIK